MSTKAKPRLTLVFEGWQFPSQCYPLVQSIFIILYWTSFKQSRSNKYLSLYFVLRKFKRSYDASQNLCWTVRTVDYFLEYHPSASNITRCQVLSRVRAWFHDSAGDINCYQISLSKSESTNLHESIIFV